MKGIFKRAFSAAVCAAVSVSMLCVGSAVANAEYAPPDRQFRTDLKYGKVMTGVTVGMTVGQLADETGADVTATANDGTVMGADSLIAHGTNIEVTSGKAISDAFMVHVFGDVDSDGRLSSSDVLGTAQAMLGVYSPDDIQSMAMDINHDGAISSTDLLALQQNSLGIAEISQTIPDTMPSETKNVNICCIGDSITAATGVPSAYRYELFKRLYTAGANFSFVGPNKNADVRMSSAYQNHAGYGGRTIGPDEYRVSSSSPNGYNIYSYFDKIFNPDGKECDIDIALVMAGHNNYYHNIQLDTIMDTYETFLREIFRRKPGIKVYVATMINEGNTGVAPDKGAADGLNAQLPSLVEKLRGERFDIHFVDMGKKTDLQRSDFPSNDITHPNEQGCAKIGDVWYEAIVDDVLEMCSTGTPDAEQPVSVTGVSLADSERTLWKGTQYTLKPMVTPSDAKANTVIWTSSDSTVATVDDNGRVNAVNNGTTRITATTIDGSYTASCRVTVVDNPDGLTVYSNVYSTNFYNDKELWSFEAGGVTDADELASLKNKVFTSGGISVGYIGKVLNTKNSTVYNATDNFRITVDMLTSSNEGNAWGHYNSFAFGGLELRIYDNAMKVSLYKGSAEVASWSSPSAEFYRQSYILRYNRGEISVFKGTELLFTASVTADSTSSGVGIRCGEIWRQTKIYNLKIEKAV
jgi:uncharacterized protein YjdB